jgi:hypothetical protein
MPGASATGHFAHHPMMEQPTTAAKIVATNTAPKSMSALDRILGLTTIIYAIVKKVAIPAKISVRNELPFASISK